MNSAKQRLKIASILYYGMFWVLPIVVGFGFLTLQFWWDRDSPRALSNRGVAYVRNAQYDQAIEVLGRAIQYDPNDTVALTSRGYAYVKKGECDLALQDLDQAVRLDPDNVLILNSRGLAYSCKGDYDRAIQDFDQAMRLKPDYADTSLNRSLAYNDKGEYVPALRDINNAIRLDPNNSADFLARSSIYAQNGHDDLAEGDMTKAVSLDPNNPGMFLARALIHYSRGEYNLVLQDYDIAIRLNANSHDMLLGRGEIKFLLAEPKKPAIDDLWAAVWHNKTDPYGVIWLHLARARAGQDDRQEFERNVAWLSADKWPAPIIALYRNKVTVDYVREKAMIGDKVTQRNQTCEADFYIGEMYLQRNMKGDARKAFQAAVAECPMNFVEKNGAATELKVQKF